MWLYLITHWCFSLSLSLSLSLFLLFVCSHSSLEGVTSFPDNFPLHQKDRRFYSIYIKRFGNKNNLAFSLNGEAIWKSNNSHLIKGEALDIDHRITKQQYTPLFSLNGTWVVERPVVWHANKKTRLKGTKNLPRQFFPKTISLQLNRFSLAPCETTRLIYLPVVESSPTHAKGVYETIEVVRTWNFSSNSKKTVESRKKKPLKINLANQILFPRCLSWKIDYRGQSALKWVGLEGGRSLL